ncbi:MauE/DoxX family redox-associated membrane protein [Echinicola shivajiensis]|uniref:MauE/DoxX family redox-associated membrane protein n=1 Tax=Echinicola shivajiensis TaxID=1035916 RepID=UPI001BFC79F5|nr:MauE/DoxX family redox-associated membrane protein [Echinicola shivajiensis]
MERIIKIYRELIPLLVAMLFVYTAVSKVYDSVGTMRALYNQVFPHWMAELIFYGLPVIELVIAVMVLLPKFRRKGMWAGFLLMIAFTAYISLVMGDVFDRVPCSCGGVLSSLGWEEHLVFNLSVLVMMVIWLIKYDRGSEE